jgi:hypothetical protein
VSKYLHPPKPAVFTRHALGNVAQETCFLSQELIPCAWTSMPIDVHVVSQGSQEARTRVSQTLQCEGTVWAGVSQVDSARVTDDYLTTPSHQANRVQEIWGQLKRRTRQQCTH